LCKTLPGHIVIFSPHKYEVPGTNIGINMKQSYTKSNIKQTPTSNNKSKLLNNKPVKLIIMINPAVRTITILSYPSKIIFLNLYLEIYYYLSTTL